MSDTDTSYEDSGPPVPFDAITYINEERRRAIGRGITTLGDNADQAARAVQLGKATGTDPSIIYPNIDNFEEQHRARLTSSLLQSSDYLRQYINDNPIHASVSNDDYANLDEVSQKLIKLALPYQTGLVKDTIADFTTTVAGAAWQGFKKSYVESVLEAPNVRTEDLQNYRLLTSLMQSVRFPVDLGGSIIHGATEGVLAGTTKAYEMATGDKSGAQQFGRDIAGMAEMMMTGTSGIHTIPRPTPAQMAKVHGVLDRARPWVDADREPPRGIDPEIDKLKYEQSKVDVDNLEEATKAAQASATRERDPDIFASFVKQHTNAEIGLSGDAVARLYGDKPPMPDDGLLGWVPGIAEKLELARRSGEDVTIPLGDWVAKIDPELMKELKDDIRVRPGNITKNEWDLQKEFDQAREVPQPPPIPEEVPLMRAAGTLEPMLSIGDRKLKLERLVEDKYPRIDDFHDFSLNDEAGNPVGTLNLSLQKGGKQIYVEMINGINGLGPRDFGPALMRDLLRQIKEEFPEAESITGHRVSGAREKAGVEMTAPMPVIKLDDPGLRDLQSIHQLQQALQEQHWARIADGLDTNLKPTETYTAKEVEIAAAVREELAKIVPKNVDVHAVAGLRGEDKRPIHGAYIPQVDRLPMLLYSLTSDSPLATARHEAIHHLRQYGFFKEGEWQTLQDASLAEGWIKKYDIDNKYRDGSPSLKLEESIAEAYQDWARGRDKLAERAKEVEGVKSPLDAIFERIHEFIQSLKQRFAEIFGHEPTWEELFESVSKGEVGAREGAEPILRGAFRPSMQEVVGRDIFEKANALGMSIEQYKRYEKLIERRHTEDVESATKRITEEQRRRQTKEWKENRAATRQQVAEEINLRPDIAADNYFADGMLYGEKIPDHEKLGTDFLTEEQRAALPRDYYRKDGVHPDELAPLFGYPDGATLIQHLSDLSEQRRTSGMRPIEFKRRMIDIETDRQMELKYGVLGENILEAVKEQVASETQLNLLHEETLYYGMKSGQEPAFDQKAVKRFVADEFDRSPMTSISSDRFLATAGRAGKAVENALLKQDFAAAFREKQRQYYATLLAKEAIGFEMQVAKFEKLANRLSKREVPAVEPEYLDFIHGLLLQAGMDVKRNANEIAASKLHYDNESFPDFVRSKNGEGWDLAVSDEIQQGIVKPLNQMTVAEFRDYNDAIISLNFVGRAVRKIEIAGEKADWNTFRQSVISNIQQLPERARENQNRWLYKIDASLTRMEEIAKDLDLRKELGPLHQAVIEPMMRSKAKEFDLMTDLSKHFQETRGQFDGKWRKSLKDTINQDVLHDPYTGAAYDMTRENLIQVMLNWGNRSNIGKFVNGAGLAKFGRRLSREEFAAYEAQIKALIDKHATAEDWQFVRRMWEPFKGWREQMETVSRNTSGVVPRMVEIGEVETPHGTFEGGYWPVKYDRLGSHLAVIEDRKPAKEGVFGADYFRAATAKGYLKERTGYVDFVDISSSLEQAAGTMQQTIHDIAFRDSLIQAGRVFYDKGIRAAIRKHYGAEYEAQLVPWLRRIAHQFSTDDASIAGYNDFMRRVRINLVGHALPLNLKVILSPDVGVPNPKAWTSYMANRAENVKLAMEKSDEIRHLVYNMDRDFRESLDRITFNPALGDFQKKAVQWGFVPIAKVSQEFRISTFVDQYYKALGRGKTEAEASLIADSFVRERHGAASVVDLPAVMQSNEGMKMLTMFYGYFNTMYNWQRQLPGNLRRGEAKEFAVNGLGSVVVGAAFGAALFNQRKQDDSWFKIIGKALLLQPLSTVPVLNTAASYYAEGYSPRTPIASLLGAAGSIITDAKKASRRERIEKPIQHVSNVVGLATGLPLAQLGRTGQFAYDVGAGRQRPKNIAEWARGIISGEAKLKK